MPFSQCFCHHRVVQSEPGFDHWISFRGQGTYLPSRNGWNINGRRVPQKGYITDELTGYAVEWIEQRKKDQPYFLDLSHKAVHAEFIPAERHKNKYAGKEFKYPVSMAATGDKARGRPMWVQNQRNSWHGVEYPYHSELNIAEYYQRYAETLCAVDDSIGKVFDTLKARGELDSTLVIYMGDNGFAFGEHGLIDKRTAYEESMRVPMLARCPELFSGGKVVREVVANIDIMPTVMEAMGVKAPSTPDGRSWLPVVSGRGGDWRKELLYEYYWERNFPQTPTMHALRSCGAGACGQGKDREFELQHQRSGRAHSGDCAVRAGRMVGEGEGEVHGSGAGERADAARGDSGGFSGEVVRALPGRAGICGDMARHGASYLPGGS